MPLLKLVSKKKITRSHIAITPVSWSGEWACGRGAVVWAGAITGKLSSGVTTLSLPATGAKPSW